MLCCCEDSFSLLFPQSGVLHHTMTNKFDSCKEKRVSKGEPVITRHHWEIAPNNSPRAVRVVVNDDELMVEKSRLEHAVLTSLLSSLLNLHIIHSDVKMTFVFYK